MKKLLAALLSLFMLFSFVSCGLVDNPEDIRGEQTNNSTSASEVTKEEPEFSMGNTESLTYESKFIGIGCTFDEGWTFYDDAKIKELNNATADLAGEEFKELMKEATLVYDMFAISSNQIDNVNINLEKINKLTLATMDIKKTMETSYELLEDSLSNMGYTNFTHKIETAEIDGKVFDALAVSSEISGFKIYQKIINIKCNGYLASIAISSGDENTINSIIEDFYILK